MFRGSVSILFLLASASLLAFGADDEVASEEERTLLQLLRRGLFDCKKQLETCSGFPKCCGTLQCYWENGYSAFKSGVCVPCIDRTLKCQKNEQCCEPLTCQKNSIYSVDGTCDVKRPGGGSCYRDSQCQSGKCEIRWYEKLAKDVGSCTNVTRRSLYDDE